MSKRTTGEIQNLYPAIWDAYVKGGSSSDPVPGDAWGLLHDLHLLQTVHGDTEVMDIVWTLRMFSLAEKKADGREGAEVVKALIRGMPASQHEAWYELCRSGGRLSQILASHPNPQGANRNHAAVAKTALAIGVILEDFLQRRQTLHPWQRAFLHKEVSAKRGGMLREAQQIVTILSPDCFVFMFGKMLIRAGSCAPALELVRQSPPEKLSEIIQYGDPAQRHSYFELYPYFLTHNGATEADGLLKHLVQAEAYSDESLMTFLQNDDLKDVVAFVLNFLSYGRQQTPATGELANGGDSAALEKPARRKCCPLIFGGKSQPCVGGRSKLMKFSNIPHVLLRDLVQRFRERDPAGREYLLHEREFQQALEVVLVLNQSEVIVRVAERLSDVDKGCLKDYLQEWTRLHLLRVLEQNRPPVYNAKAPGVQRLVAKQGQWTWTSSETRSHYFKSDLRRSEDIAVVLWMYFELSMFIDPTIIRRFLVSAPARIPSWAVLDEFMPADSQLFDVVGREMTKRTVNLVPNEVKLLMRSPGFYDPDLQSFMKDTPTDGLRAVFNKDMAFARLMQVVARLVDFPDGHMDKAALEASLSQICGACYGSNTCLSLFTKVIDATLKKATADFVHEGAKDVLTEPSLFTVAGLASCARRLREACDMVRNNTVQLTFGRVVSAFLDTPPRGWVPLFNSLETVLFFLRFLEKEDLSLAYEKFEAENVGAFKEDKGMSKLLADAKEFYKEPFIDLQTDLTDLCNLDVREKLSKKKLAGKARRRRFGADDWNVIVDIAACAAESMKEKYNLPMLPHHSQMVTLLMFGIQVCQGPGEGPYPRTVLARVGTGEGKSWIIGMLAAFCAKKGMRAHVVIDNDMLLERDHSTMSLLFTKLGLTVEKNYLDKEAQVVYCSSMDIELHFMAKMKDNAKSNNSISSVMIVDEVDSLIVDENVYKCYVDDYLEGSEVAHWWMTQGRNESPYYQEPWKRKIMQQLESASSDMHMKREGRHYVVDQYTGMLWALDERTSLLKRSTWYLWLELMRKERFSDYRVRYMTRQNVICRKSCFSSYTFIFGLTGSLGTEAEMRYTKKHFNASHFFVPCFLDTCRGQTRPRPVCLLSQLETNATKQLESTVKAVREHCISVPIIVVTKNPDRVRTVVDKLRSILPAHEAGDQLGPGVIELIDCPGKEVEFQQMVETATQPLEVTDAHGNPGRLWRVTVTTAVGARGQDYRISDELVDEKGGCLLVLEYVPDSEREWIQFLGRTARHDHPGQYAVILNVEDYTNVPGIGKAASDGSIIKTILEHVGKEGEQRLDTVEEEIFRGVLMHHYTAQWWSWSAKNMSKKADWQEKFSQWVDLCEGFETMAPDSIRRTFEAIGLDIPAATLDALAPTMDSISRPSGKVSSNPKTAGGANDGPGQESSKTRGGPGTGLIGTGAYEGEKSADGKRHGVGKYIFPDGRVYYGQWANGKMAGTGEMKWPNGQLYKGEYHDDRRSGFGEVSWPDGRSYKGNWLKGKQHGLGTYTNEKGRTWDGEWNDGKKVESVAKANNKDESPKRPQSSSRQPEPKPQSSSRQPEPKPQGKKH